MTSPASAPPGGATTLERLGRLVGERTVPQLWHENYWFRRHELAYRALAPLIVDAARTEPGSESAGAELSPESAGAEPGPGSARPEPIDAPAASPTGTPGVVVEAGSGEGYGAALLHRAGAVRIAALDYDAAALGHAASAYPPLAGKAARANLARLPLATGSAAAICSFQVIEHLWTPWEFLDECARVLRPGGLLVVTTPNRLTFSPGLGRGEKPPNPFHIREFDADELRALINPRLPVTNVLVVSHGPRLLAWQAEHGDLIEAQLAQPADRWPDHLADLVRSVSADDFVLAPPSAPQTEVLDLVVLARRAS